MSRLRWPDSTNSVSEKPGTIQTTGFAATLDAPSPQTLSSCEAIG